MRATRRSVVLIVVMTLASAWPAAARDGDLDPTFGRDGKVITGFRGGAYANAVAVGPHGRIVVVGAAAGPHDLGVFALARYLPDGRVDRSLGGDGRVVTAIAGGGDEARDVAVLADGTIVVVGTDSLERFAVVRYRPNGQLDRTFGDGGIVRTDLGDGQESAEAVAIAPNGRIVVAGWAGSASPKYAVVRYRPGGALDRTFGEGGIVLTPFGWGKARDVAIAPDGRIVVAGFCSGGMGVARYRPDGRLDRSFGDGGRVQGKVGSEMWQVWALALALQPDGRILVAGDYGIFAVGVARLQKDGRLDRTWGGDGVVSTQVGGGEQAITWIGVQPNGRVVAVGGAGPHEVTDDVTSRFIALRYRPSGHPDRTWGGDGKVVTFFPGGARASGGAMQSDGRVLAAGGLGRASAQRFAVARYLA